MANSEACLVFLFRSCSVQQMKVTAVLYVVLSFTFVNSNVDC